MKVFIECERGSKIKRRYGMDYGLVKQEEILLPYPYPYGFVPGTESDDGECVDCYILTDEALRHGAVIEVEPVGLLPMTENDENDAKMLAVLPGHSLADFPGVGKLLRRFITGIFRKFPGVRVRVGEILSREAAVEFLSARDATKKKAGRGYP